MKTIVSVRTLSVLAVGLAFVPVVASAHSTVSPSQTETSKYETFTLSVPTEKDVPTVRIRLVVPETLDRVTPFVKPGWTITTKKSSDDKVTEIEWTGGAIPAGQKDIFQFTARTSATSSMLIWKAYQTYRGGEIVAWDRDPAILKEGEERVTNPYSVTDVVSATKQTAAARPSDLPFVISIVSLIVSFIAVMFAIKKPSV